MTGGAEYILHFSIEDEGICYAILLESDDFEEDEEEKESKKEIDEEKVFPEFDYPYLLTCLSNVFFDLYDLNIPHSFIQEVIKPPPEQPSIFV
ncbi:hypothetical protein BC781_103227 [Sediminitomix flava]|uniref:Uncharacterized protein n=1 Tax=Sediminitomix flava TaxID=379075 RepID=A0A315ZXB0_SEDFL|nr:hypothetical protein BC781_103227 [Sediminitomix flava]